MALTLPNAFNLPVRKENWIAQLFNTYSYMSFDGSNDYVDHGLTTASSVTSVNISMSFAMWVKFPTLGSDEQIFANNSNESAYAGIWIMKDSSNRISIQWGNAGGAGEGNREGYYNTTAFIDTADKWYFIGGTTDFDSDDSGSGTAIVYGDETNNNVTFITGSDLTNFGTSGDNIPDYLSSNAYMYFGRRGDTTNTDFGKFDIRNFALFSSVLNSDNADSLHNDGSYRSWLYDYNNYNQSSSLLAYWEFNNGTDDIRDLVGDSHGVNNGATPKGYTSLGFYDTSIDNYPVYGALLNKPSIRESINLDKSKAKTGNLSLSVANFKYLNDDFSAEFGGNRHYINRTVFIYIQPNDAENLSDCLKIYTGRLSSISHNESTIRLQITAKNPWDDVEIPQTQSTINKNYFPIAYGDFRPNASTASATSPSISTTTSSDIDEFRGRKTLYPIPVDTVRGSTVYALTGEWSQGSKAWPHYYEKSIDSFLPITNHATDLTSFDLANEVYDDGYAITFHKNLRKTFLFKPVERISSDTGWASDNNMFDGLTTVDTSSSFTQFSRDAQTFTDDTTRDISFKMPTLTGTASSLSIYPVVKGSVAFNKTGGSGFARIEIINYSYSNEDILAYWRFNATTGSTGSITSTYSVPGNDINAAGAPYIIGSNGDISDNFRDSGDGWGDNLVIRIKEEHEPGAYIAGTFTADIRFYDLVLMATTFIDFSVQSTTGKILAAQFLNDIEYVYSGGDGLTAIWDGDQIGKVHEAHRDLLHRFTSYSKNNTPENWSDLDSAKSWDVRYWVTEPKPLIKCLEQLQYEGGFIFRFNGQNKGQYIFVENSPSTSTVITQDDILDLDIESTPFDRIITKYEWEYEKHPAKRTYLKSKTSSSDTLRAKYLVENKENTKKVRLDAYVSTPATGPGANTNADIYSYYNNINGEVKFLISCTIINPSLYGIDVGDLVKFTGTMPVDPLADAWTSKVFMCTSVQRKIGELKCKFREVT